MIIGSNPVAAVLGSIVAVPLSDLVVFPLEGTEVAVGNDKIESKFAVVVIDAVAVACVTLLVEVATGEEGKVVNPITFESEAKIPVGAGRVALPAVGAMVAVGAGVGVGLIAVVATTTIGELVPLEMTAEVVIITMD